MPNLEILLRAGGFLHFAVLIASAMVPKMLDWRNELSHLRPFARQHIWVLGAFIVLTIAGFGVLSVAHAGTLVSGEPLARSVCALIALFWLARLAIQLFFFEAGPILTTTFRKMGYHLLTAIFTYFALVYGWAALATS